MKFIAIFCMGLLLTACVSTSPQNQSDKPDLHEAARINTELGVDYMRRGHMDLAEEKLERAIREDPDYAVAHSSLAFLYARRGDNDKAEQEYRRALDLDSGNPDTRNNFGVFLCGRGKVKEAEKYFMQAAQSSRFATPEAAWTNAGVCIRHSDPAQAERDFRQALKVNPGFPDALLQMALISYQRKDYLRTLGFLQRYQQVAKDSAAILWLRAKTEKALGDSAAAQRYEQRLKTEFPAANPADDIAKKMQP